MTSQHDKAKRWRPTFSVKTLVIVVTLMCVYFGSWTWVADRAFKESEELARDTYVRGGLDMGTYSYSASSRLPYVVGVDQMDAYFGIVGTREYYFWFFGYVAKLPFDRKVRIDYDISHYLDATTSIP